MGERVGLGGLYDPTIPGTRFNSFQVKLDLCN